MSLISLKDVSLGYEGHPIVEGLDLDVYSGDYICIVGENGSGKSTLLKTMLGLQQPLKGKITFGDGLKKNEIGYLPQQTVVQKDFPATVREIVLSGCQARGRFHPFYTKADKESAEYNMNKMNIESISGKCYRDLSGGQQQRVLLARALCASGKILFLDEPVSGLDPKATEDMYETIEKLNISGMTVIMISHDVKASLRYADHILHIKQSPFFAAKDEYIRSDLGKSFTACSEGGNVNV